MSERLKMEKQYSPGFKTYPAVHVGSQTMRFFDGSRQEQAYEVRHMAAVRKDDLIVVRDIDQDYVKYWNSLMDFETNVITAPEEKRTSGDALTKVVLESPDMLGKIKDAIPLGASLMVFLPTQLEQNLADALEIPLHGAPAISDKYGTKSGIRRLAKEVGITMAPGFICETVDEVKEAMSALSSEFNSVAIKHDLSTGGGWSKRLGLHEDQDVGQVLNDIAEGNFLQGKDVMVVEGWLENTTASLCAHIEILDGKDPVICAGWGQVMDTDGITYLGAGPLNLSDKALQTFNKDVQKLAKALKAKGAVGSFAPDFLITDSDESVLLELNARVPATAFPLEIVKQVRGEIGNGFYSQHVTLPHVQNFTEIAQLLKDNNLLVTDKSERAKGIVPFNVGLLPWKKFDIVAMAQSWEETVKVVEKVNLLFK